MPPHNDISCLLFTPDNKLMYSVEEGNKKFLLIGDEKKYGPYDEVSPPGISSDGKHFHFAAIKGNYGFLLVDGREGKHYDIRKSTFYHYAIGKSTLGPDGQHIAYIVNQGEEKVILDDEEGSAYDKIKEGPIFSPDSKHLVYVGQREGKDIIILDGKEISYDKFNSFNP